MNEWISVKDRLPHRDWDNYLLLSVKPYNTVIVGWFDGNKFLHTSIGSELIMDLINVTHWMPLPEPPKDNLVCLHKEVHFISLLTTNDPHLECSKCGEILPLPETPK